MTTLHSAVSAVASFKLNFSTTEMVFDFIDYVVKFEDDTPYDLIKAVQPDILVKGGDYKIEDIVGHDIVEAKGGLVTTIQLVDGMSTTNIINAVNAAHHE